MPKVTEKSGKNTLPGLVHPPSASPSTRGRDRQGVAHRRAAFRGLSLSPVSSGLLQGSQSRNVYVLEDIAWTGSGGGKEQWS